MSSFDGETPIIISAKKAEPDSIQDKTTESVKKEVSIKETTQEQSLYEKVKTCKNVKLSDSDENLELYCYIDCTNSDDDLVKNSRGVVFDTEGNLVLQGFPYTMEYNTNNKEEIEKALGDDYYVTKSYEGSLIRVFHHGTKWYISTHRKLNAFKSKWASRESFGDLFVSALIEEEKENEEFRKALSKYKDEQFLDRFLNLLNKDLQYMFLVRSSEENRIVCTPPKSPQLFHVGTCKKGKILETSDETNIFVSGPESIEFKSLSEMYDYVDNVNPWYIQGVIVFTPENKQYKILNKEYQELFNMRGNVPSVKFRYLQIRNKGPGYVDGFKKLYPNFVEKFNYYEDILLKISENIYNAYINRYIKKVWTQVPEKEYKIMKACHQDFIEAQKKFAPFFFFSQDCKDEDVGKIWAEHKEAKDEVYNKYTLLAKKKKDEEFYQYKISLQKVRHFLSKQPATNLNHMIKDFIEQANSKM